MKILIIGTGYIGGTLIKYLSPNYKIVCLDHGRYRKRIEKEVSNVLFYEGDALDEDLLDAAMRDCEIVFNLIGGGGNAACTREPLKYVRAYVLGTQKIIKKSEERNVRHIFLPSSISVYPWIERGVTKTLTEDTMPSPNDMYGALKLAQELMLENSSLNYTILRLANVYGYSYVNPIQEGGALGNFIKAVFTDEVIRIYRTGEQTIDYIHINDLCEGIGLLIRKDLEKRRLYNMGGGKLITIEELAKIVSNLATQLFHKKNRIEKVLPPPHSPTKDYALMSINKIKSDLNWVPKTNLTDGIKDMMLRYDQLLKGLSKSKIDSSFDNNLFSGACY